VYESLITLDQSVDIFAMNLESLQNLFEADGEIVADFARRGFVPNYLNRVLER